MNWEIFISTAVPVLSGVALMVYKVGTIDSKLAFLQKAIDNLLDRMDRVEKKIYRVEKKIYRVEKKIYRIEKTLYKRKHKRS